MEGVPIQKKRELFRVLFTLSPGLSTRRCRSDSPWSAAGMLSPLYFQPTRCAKLLLANQKVAITPFHKCGPTLALVPSDSCPIAVDTKPFPTSAFNDKSRISAVEYSLLQPRSALEAAPPRLTPKASQLCLHAPLHGTVFLMSFNSQQFRKTVGTGLERHPFSGLVDSAGELLHTP